MGKFEPHDLADLVALRRMVNAMHQGRKILARVLHPQDGEDDPLARMLSDLASMVDVSAQAEATPDQLFAIGAATQAIDTRADGEFAAGWIAGMQAAIENVCDGAFEIAITELTLSAQIDRLKAARDAGAPAGAVSDTTKAVIDLITAAEWAHFTATRAIEGTVTSAAAQEELARLRWAIDAMPKFNLGG